MRQDNAPDFANVFVWITLLVFCGLVWYGAYALLQSIVGEDKVAPCVVLDQMNDVDGESAP